MTMNALTFAALFAVATSALASDGHGPLARAIGKTRPLIVIAASAADPTWVRLKTFLDEPANQRAFAERNMVLFTVINGSGQRDGKNLSAETTEALMRELKPGPGTLPKVILVGKDGGKKIERSGPIELGEIFGIIDTMPMRKSESGKD